MCSNSPSGKQFDVKSVLSLMKPVVDDSLLSDTPQVNVTVCKITDKKHISRLVLELNEKCPLLSLNHLKRVYKDEIILGLSDTNLNTFVNSSVDVTGLDLNSQRQLRVSSILPKTKSQHTKLNNVWPCAFTEDKYLERLLSNSLFSLREMEEHCKWMSEAVTAARRSLIPVGAVVVDPDTKTVLAVASDDRSSNPMKHAVMVVVDLVARTQGGGLWPVAKEDFVVKDNARKLLVEHSKRKIDCVEKHEGPYLCTGYDVYVTREPCTMCAMALIHSRARRVFYGSSNKAGALGTLVKIHTLKGLNHRYEVFKSLLVQECDSLYNKDL